MLKYTKLSDIEVTLPMCLCMVAFRFMNAMRKSPLRYRHGNQSFLKYYVTEHFQLTKITGIFTHLKFESPDLAKV